MKKFSFILAVAVIFTIATAFTNKQNKSDNYTSETVDSTVKAYYFKQCTFCHNQSERLAPYMPNIKKIYLMNYPDEATFVENVSGFVMDPKPEKRLYKAASFETMPPEMFHDPGKIKDVARYIYRENDL